MGGLEISQQGFLPASRHPHIVRSDKAPTGCGLTPEEALNLLLPT